MSFNRRRILSFILLTLPMLACTDLGSADAAPPAASGPALALEARPATVEKVVKTPDEWRKLLAAEPFRVLREQGTERAFSGALWDHHEKGVYRCAACGLDLFASADKFDSGTGWPSYTQAIAPGFVEQSMDDSHGMVRDEVHCARCGGHLGHVFDDGPAPTGKRFCINSASLIFTPAK